MKILFLNAFYAPHIGGGAEVILRHLAEGLQRRGCEVAVLATGPDAGLSMQLQDGVRVYRAGLANHYWHYTQQRPGRLARLGWHYRDRYNADMRQHVREVIQREQPEIVVSNNLTGWSILYKHAEGTGTVTCDNGQSARVKISVVGGGLTAGKYHIDNGKGEISKVHSIDDVFGAYAQAGAEAGVVKSGSAQVLTKGTTSLALAGTGEGVNLGISVGKFTITRE